MLSKSLCLYMCLSTPVCCHRQLASPWQLCRIKFLLSVFSARNTSTASSSHLQMGENQSLYIWVFRCSHIVIKIIISTFGAEKCLVNFVSADPCPYLAHRGGTQEIFLINQGNFFIGNYSIVFELVWKF